MTLTDDSELSLPLSCTDLSWCQID